MHHIFAAFAILIAGAPSVRAESVKGPSAVLADQCQVAAKEFDMRGKDDWAIFDGAVSIGICIGKMQTVWFQMIQKRPDCIPGFPHDNRDIAQVFVDYMKYNPGAADIVEAETIEFALLWRYCGIK